MGFKVRLSHLIVPGKYEEMAEWFRIQDKERSENDSNYRTPKRYINQFGESFRVECEFMFDDLPSGSAGVWSDQSARVFYFHSAW